MAQVQISTLPPNISLPPVLKLFIDGFNALSEKESKLLFKQAIDLIACNSNITNKSLKYGYSLFRMINPQDELEQVWCAQFILSHLLGIDSLALPSPKDKRIGLKLLKAADGAMERIQNKRNGTLSCNPTNKEKRDAS